MRRSYFVLIFLYICFLAHVLSANIRRVAVVIADFRLDDKMALRVLTEYGQYDHIVIVVSGIKNIKGAISDYLDFQSKLKSTQNEDKHFYKYVQGEVRSQPIDHEVTFFDKHNTSWTQDIPPLVEVASTLLRDGDMVDIWHLAPLSHPYLKLIYSQKNMNVRQYHLVHGFNSQQLNETATYDKQWEFLTNIQSNIIDIHPNAKVIFTNNFASFKMSDGSGSRVDYTTVKDLIPKDHIDSAIRDHFTLNMLLDVSKFVIGKRNASFVVSFVTSVDESSTKSLEDLILTARVNENGKANGLRSKFVQFIDAYLPYLQKTHRKQLNEMLSTNMFINENNLIPTEFLGRLEKTVKETFTNPLHLELCDANHVIAVLASNNQLKTRYSHRNFEHVHLVRSELSNEILFASLNDQNKYVAKTLNDLSIGEIVLDLKYLLNPNSNALMT